MNNYTRFCAFAAIAILIVCGSTLYCDAVPFSSTGGTGMTVAKAVDILRPAAEMSSKCFQGFAMRQKRVMRGAQVAVDAVVATPANVGYTDYGDKLTLKWDKVEGASEYRVYEAGATSAEAKRLGSTSTTSYDIVRSTDSGEDVITLFGVTAVVGGVESAIAESPVLTTGEIARLPWEESFRNGQTDKFFWTERTSDQQWGLLTDASGLASIDGDNGVLGFLAQERGDYFNIHTGKIALTGNPYLVFARYYRPTQNVALTVVASFPDGTSKQVFQSDNIGTAAAYWKTELVNLSAYKDYRYCTLSFNFVSNETFSDGGALVALDGLRVIDNKNVDVAAELALPSKVLKGQTVEGELYIYNNSLYTTPNLTVNITVNGTSIISGSLNGTLGALAKGVLPVSIATSSLMEAEQMEVVAEMTAVGDEVPANDTDARTIALEQTWRNPVASMRAFRTPENGISLEWSAPSSNSKAVEDGFESYAPWATEFGEWTMVDNDKAFHGGVFPVSDYPGQLEQFAFKVMTPEEIGEENNARTGRSYLGGPFGVLDNPDEGATYAASDAWLISPELSGESQVGSFYAASTPAYNAWWEKYDQTDESFYIMYSTAGNAVADFKDFCYAGSISNKNIVDDEHYVKVEFSIPEGARYFAIHHVTPAGDGCMLRLDDFAYVAGGTPVAYKVYADGEYLDSGAATSYLDAEPQAAVYAVTAIYRDGSESLPVEIAADQASLNLGVADRALAPFDIYNLQGVPVRRGVTSIDDAALPKGIYVSKGKKLVIR